MVEPLWEAVRDNDDLLTRINCLNSLGFLGDAAAAPGLQALLVDSWRFAAFNMSYQTMTTPIRSRCLSVRCFARGWACRSYCCMSGESVDALSRVVGPEYIGFLRCALMDEDPQFVSEVRRQYAVWRQVGPEAASKLNRAK